MKLFLPFGCRYRPTYLALGLALALAGCDKDDETGDGQSSGEDGETTADDGRKGAAGPTMIADKLWIEDIPEQRGDAAIFDAKTEEHGSTVWSSDGTTVADLLPETEASKPGYFRWAADKLYFRATVGKNGEDEDISGIFATDGTPANTVELGRVEQNITGIAPLEDADSTVIFSVDQGLLWKLDGSEASQYANLPEMTDQYDAEAEELTSAGDRAVFSMESDSQGTELWVTDGTESGTEVLQDICPGDCSSYPRHFARINGTTYFTARPTSSGDRTLYSTDGTESGTVELSAIPGTVSRLTTTIADDQLYMLVGDAIFKTDGTPSGTTKVVELDITNFAVLDNVIYYGAVSGTSGGVKAYDVATGKTSTLLEDDDDGTYARPMVYATDSEVFAFEGVAGSGEPFTIWKSDGTQDGTEVLKAYDVEDVSEFEATNVFTTSGRLFYQIDRPKGMDELWAY